MKQILKYTSYAAMLALSFWSFMVLCHWQTTGRFATLTVSGPVFLSGLVFMAYLLAGLLRRSDYDGIRMNKILKTLLLVLFMCMSAYAFCVAFLVSVFSVFGQRPGLHGLCYRLFIVELPCLMMLVWCTWGVIYPLYSLYRPLSPFRWMA